MTSQAKLACQLAIVVKQVREIQDVMYRLGFMAAPPAIAIRVPDGSIHGADGGSDFKFRRRWPKAPSTDEQIQQLKNTIEAMKYAAKQNAENSVNLMVHDELMTRERDALKAQLEHLTKSCTTVNLDDAMIHGDIDLFRRYIKHVRDCEGVDFITAGAHHNEASFTAGEWCTLRNLAKWVKP